MENPPLMPRGVEKIIKHVEILGSKGKIFEKNGDIFWYMNGTTKEVSETQPVWPIIELEIKRIRGADQIDKISHIRISPAVAIHLFFEGHITPEEMGTAIESDSEIKLASSKLRDLSNHADIRFIVEQNMLEKRDGSDILVLDKNNCPL